MNVLHKEPCHAGSNGRFPDSFIHEFSWTNFKSCFTWYPTDITLCLWCGLISPRIRTFVEKRFHGLFFQKEGFEIWGCSFVSARFTPRGKTLLGGRGKKSISCIGRRGWSLRKKGKKQKKFLVLSPRPGPDGPNASGWYRRLHEPISPFSMFNSVQL